jgi:hypothetical protein
MSTALGTTFDATQVDPNTRPEPVPAGWYNVMITQGENKATKSGTGGFAELGMKILDGAYAGRMLFDRLNLWNQNPVAVEIAQKQLSAICHAIGVYQVNDLQQLFGRPLMARVIVKPADGDYDAGNEVKNYDKTGAHQTVTSAPTATPSSNGPTAPPWAGAQQPTQPPAPPVPPAPAPTPAPAPEPPQQPVFTPPPATQSPATAGAAPVTPPWAK